MSNAAQASCLIHMQGVYKVYLMGAEEVFALRDVSLRIQEREFVAIIGPSGSGKSTLMNIIGCLDTPDAGTYLLEGQDISRMSPRSLGVIRNRKIGFIFQQFNLLQKLNALENVELPMVYQGLAHHERRARAMNALDLVGLRERMKHRPNELSGGQQQRVAIARALASGPSLILADEPTGNLDSHSGREVMQTLHHLHEQGNTIVLITHDSRIASEADRQVLITDGEVSEGIGGERQ